MSAIEFLRDVGKHFPVNRMLAREVVKARLETGISFTEFSYQLLQSHDFFELHQRYGCMLQFGGSDQWGNITAGVDYIRRRGGGPVHAFTTPLVTKADGTKFGKTEGGAVWLDPRADQPVRLLPVLAQHATTGTSRRYLRYFSFRSHDEIEELETRDGGAARRAAGAAGAGRGADHAGARRGGDRPGGRGEPGAVRPGLAGRPRRRRRCGPRCRRGRAGHGTARARPRSRRCSATPGWSGSLNEARRAITEGGAYVNNERVSDVEAVVAAEALLHGRFLVLRRGKRTFAGVERVTRSGDVTRTRSRRI